MSEAPETLSMNIPANELTSETPETGPPFRDLSVEQLDLKLEQAVRELERSEMLICEVLFEMNKRRGHEKFGFNDIYYYTEERFGFAARKTRYLLQLGYKLQNLPRLRKALAEGRLGWSKATRVARMATDEDETMWLDSALSLSVRELDRKIQEERGAAGVKVRAWLTEDQAAVWDNALEVCRRLAGEDLDAGRCLELIAGEFLATYAYLAHHQDEEQEAEQNPAQPAQPVQPVQDDPAVGSEESSADERPTVEQHVCPENDELPSAAAVISYNETIRQIFERDDYRCQYPDCAARSQLHPHHIEFRSKSGRKSRPPHSNKTDSPSNLLTLCVFHHRMLHAGTIGVKGRADGEGAETEPGGGSVPRDRNPYRSWSCPGISRRLLTFALQ
jgi:hypothetical protein